MILGYEYTTEVMFAPEVTQHNILLRCLPARLPFQSVLEENFCLSEGFWHREGCDGLGNRVVSAGTSLYHSSLCYTSKGVVSQDTYCIPEQLPSPMYLLPSRLTMVERTVLDLLPPLGSNFLANCLAIAHAVYTYLEYVPSATDMGTSAQDVFLSRRGVCQDYAHLMIALCRAAGYHARYVCGLMMGEGHTHAWVEVHDGQCWYAFDPTNDTAVAFGYIKLAHGRDVLDCPVSRGMYVGISQQTTSVRVKVAPNN